MRPHAILSYLASAFPGIADHWYPADLMKRAKINSVLDWHHTNLHLADSGEVHEEDKAHAENTKKTTLKTPARVEALEKLHSEHTYPTESIKAQLAKDISLSEKQVSDWFCHRRLKEKNLLLMKDGAHLMGRQDLSSGVIQDCGSALKQDSCSSTRPGEYTYFDPREVESRRLCGQESPAEDLANRNRSQYVHTVRNSNMDNTSSGFLLVILSVRVLLERIPQIRLVVHP